jgi:hypothetical protein
MHDHCVCNGQHNHNQNRRTIVSETFIIETKHNHKSGATIKDFAKQKLQSILDDLRLIDTLFERDNTADHPRDLKLAVYKILLEVDETLFIYFGGDDE